MKRGIRYLRFSSTGQSNCSIEWQKINTMPWFQRNNVELIDTFIDEGHSARTFDRPDILKLNDFIKKYHTTVDYLVVNEFTRFSRKAGEAITLVEKLQSKYGVQIVSVNEGITYDYNDNDSFLRSGLSFIFAEEENRKRINHIRGGIYASKKKEGRYLGRAPIGYKNEKDGRKPILTLDEQKAPVVEFIFQSFLNDVPFYLISEQAKKMGLANTGNSAIQRILTNPVYTGLLHISAFKDHPEELVEGINPKIIGRTVWQSVQNKMKIGKPMQIVNDEFPLRSILLCHCGKPITGAPSRGKGGNYFNYYKCQTAGHNNISTRKAHEKILQVFQYMSLPEFLIEEISNSSEEILKARLKSDETLLQQRHSELNANEKKLKSVEEKWIENQMTFDTYQRWYKEITNKRISLQAEIERLSNSSGTAWNLLSKEIYKLKYLREIYEAMPTLEKQVLVKTVFDSQLYFKDQVYRTPYIMPGLNHNTLILKQKELLVLDEKREMRSNSLWVERTGIEPVIPP